MRVIVDIGHPGHVHLYKHLIKKFIKDGHFVLVTTKNIPVAIELLNKYKIKHINLGNKPDSLIGKALYQFKYNYKLFKLIKKNKIKYGIGTSISLAQLTKLSNIKTFFFEDDDDQEIPFSVKYAHPFITHMFSPDCLKNKQKRNDVIYYHGYHELAYLHPDRFTPDKTVLTELNLTENSTFFVVRFNVFKAHHDIGQTGLSFEQKQEIISLLKPYGTIFITTERKIDSAFREYQLKMPPDKIHSLLYYSTMFIGDSQTMTSEAAILGTPALKCNTFAGNLSIPNEIEEKYGLCYSYQPSDFNLMKEKIRYLLKNNNLKKTWLEKRNIMLKDKIDVSSFMIWYIENYPESADLIKNKTI